MSLRSPGLPLSLQGCTIKPPKACFRTSARGPRRTAPSMNSILHHAVPSGPQSTDAFRPLQGTEYPAASGSVAFQNVASMPQHQAYSPEELRLNDYKHNRGVLASSRQPCSTDPFQPIADGLVSARVPGATPSTWLTRSVMKVLNGVPDMGTNMVAFTVGKDNIQQFIVHENVIKPRSEFVRLALSKEWKEAKERTIPLPDEESATFELYQHWVYFNHIPMDGQPSADRGKHYNLLTKAYILGEKLLDPHFKDAIIDCLIERLRTTLTFDVRLTNLIYEHTPEKSPLRRLLQDIYIWCGNATWLDEQVLGEFVNADFAVDLSKRQMSFWGGQRPDWVPFMESTCSYHEHVAGVCYRQCIG